jgi:uncharacterized protein with von Willebrand factor type A (vWA) domain
MSNAAAREGPEYDRSPFLHNLLSFGRLLRELGLQTTPEQMVDAVSVLESTDLSKRDDVFYSLRCLFVGRPEHLPIFDVAFEQFWRSRPHRGLDEGVAPASGAGSKFGSEGSPVNAERDIATERMTALRERYSAIERLRSMDFAELSRREEEFVHELVATIASRTPTIKRRRYRGPGIDHPDLRRLLRQNLRYRAEPVEVPFKRRSRKPRPLLALVDVSGSMDAYSLIALSFLYHLGQRPGWRQEVFVFGTQLTHVSPYLRGRSHRQALAEVARHVQDWSGGTRLAQALETLNRHWGHRAMKGKTLALLISDGWDRGDPEKVAFELAKVHRCVNRLLWLNPVAGSRGFEPRTRALQAARPFVDEFLPFGNLADLETIAQALERSP